MVRRNTHITKSFLALALILGLTLSLCLSPSVYADPAEEETTNSSADETGAGVGSREESGNGANNTGADSTGAGGNESNNAGADSTGAGGNVSNNAGTDGSEAGNVGDSNNSLTDREEGDNSLYFSIDDSHRYVGMAESYQQGYLPAVENGQAILILPLIGSQPAAGKTITVTPELGSTEGSPFVYRNYQKTVAETMEVPLEGGDPIAVYLVCVELELSPERYNGVYPVVLAVQAKGAAGESFTGRFTSYVTITDGKSTEVPVEQPTEKAPEFQPFLYVERYSVQPDPVTAGEEFVVKASIHNSGKDQDVKNVKFQISSDSDALTLLEQSSTIVWDELKAGQSRELSLRYRAESSISVGKYHIRLDMSFDNESAMTMSAAGDLEVMVTQPLRVEGEYPVFSDGVNAGDTLSLTFQALNLGKSDVYNVRFELDAAGLIPSGSAFIGNLASGTSGSADMRVFVGAKSMNRDLEEGADLYGHTFGNMILIYEDENGTEYREENPFSTNIHELVIGTTAAEEKPESNPARQWWIAAAGGIVILLGAGAVLLYHNWKKHRGSGK